MKISDIYEGDLDDMMALADDTDKDVKDALVSAFKDWKANALKVPEVESVKLIHIEHDKNDKQVKTYDDDAIDSLHHRHVMNTENEIKYGRTIQNLGLVISVQLVDDVLLQFNCTVKLFGRGKKSKGVTVKITPYSTSAWKGDLKIIDAKTHFNTMTNPFRMVGAAAHMALDASERLAAKK